MYYFTPQLTDMKKFIPFFSLVCLLFLFNVAQAQEKQYKVGAIGFYNLENLFDIKDDEDVRDTEFTPEGRNLWSQERYEEKLANMAYILSEIGLDLCPSGLSVIGVCEIENRSVLEDLVAHPLLADRNYQIVHQDSPDERGIDVALLYQASHFTLDQARSLELILIKDDGERNFTRDILVVSGEFDDERMHFMVNHWPSRSGGEKRSEGGRRAAAELCRTAVDSIYTEEPNAKIIIMGDLNDNPNNKSVVKDLKSTGVLKGLKKQGLYNPMLNMFRQGNGTTAWRDSWSLFDQLIVSEPLVNAGSKTYKYHSAKIFKPALLKQANGQYKGYPFRTFAGGQYKGGYSDHFPVYVYLTKEL